jgi:hypothetical protein
MEKADITFLPIVRSEVNFLVYPFFCLDNRWHTDRLTIEYHRTLDRGNGREDISWRVLGHQAYGLPGLFDWELHKALEVIINERGFPVRNPVPFGMRDVCRRMGITYSGRTAEAIKDAFLRIISTMVESKHTFYSKAKKRWIEDNFHLYDRVIYRGDELPEDGGLADTNYLYLGSWYLENLNALYVTLVDPHYRRSLSMGLARRLSEILGVKFYGLRQAHAPSLRYAYSTVCAFLPVTRHRYLSQAHRQLDAAHEELIATGFLERVEWQTATGSASEWYLYYFPGPRALAPLSALQASVSAAPPLDLEEYDGAADAFVPSTAATPALDLPPEGSAAGVPPGSRAHELVQHFRQGLVVTPPRRPSAKELQQAETLLREHGDARARAIVTYALGEARRTDFQMQHFGAVLGYQEAALAALTQQVQQAQRQEATRQRQAAEQQEMEAERAQEERAAAVVAAFPEAQRDAYRQRALAHLPPGMRDMDGLVARRMRHLVIEEGLVAQ